jgi:hypothetical protein
VAPAGEMPSSPLGGHRPLPADPASYMQSLEDLAVGTRTRRTQRYDRATNLAVRRAMIAHLAADPFFLAGASCWTAVNGAIAFRASSANFRWLASICSAKS